MKLHSKSSVYSVKKVISENERSTVCMAYRKNKDYSWVRQKVLLKIFKKNSQEYPLELDSVLQVRSPYCASVLNFENVENYPALILEWHDSLNLFQLIRQTPKLDHLETSYICSQIQKGIVDLNRQGISHGDLSLSNVLIDRRGNIRLIDFGKANYLGNEILTTSFFTAPEIFEGEMPSFYSDLYSLGVLEKILSENQKSFNKKHDYSQAGDILLDPSPQKRRLKEFMVHKKAKETLSLKVNSILSREVLTDFKKAKTLKKKWIPYNLILSGLVLMTILGSGRAVFYGSIQVRSHKWMYIQIESQSGFTPFESGPLPSGQYQVIWKTQTRNGAKFINLKKNTHLLLTEKDFL